MTTNTNAPDTNPGTNPSDVAAASTTATPTGPAAEQEALASVILDRLMPQLMAIPAEQLIQVNADIVTAVSIVLGNLPEIRELRAEIAKSMADFNLEALDKLEDYTLALYEAHGRYLIATKPRSELQQALDEGTKLREVLLSDARALTTRGLIEEGKLGELLGAVGHKNIAMDLNVLHQVFKESWPAIQGKCAVRLDEIEHAMILSQRIVRMVGLRDEGTEGVAHASDVRTRAFTAFVKAYDEVQRGVGYLRWRAGDADRIAPAIYPRRSPRRKAADAPDPTQAGPGAAPATGTQAAGSDGAGAAPAARASSGSTAGAAVQTSAGGGAPASATGKPRGGGSAGNSGSPDSEPFLS